MNFENTRVEHAIGKVLAHTVVSGEYVLSKGTYINCKEAGELKSMGVEHVSVVSLDIDDIGEKEAALKVADAILGEGLTFKLKPSGSVEIYAECNGVLFINETVIDNSNRVSSSMTVATLNANEVVKCGERVAVIKTIPYAAKLSDIETICAYLKRFKDVIYVKRLKAQKVGIIQTLNGSRRDSLHEKTEAVLRKRLGALSAEVESVIACDHILEDLQQAISEQQEQGCDLIVVVGATAIVDENDLIPSAIKGLGGNVEHYGMPVEPGHMLLLGYAKVPVIGCPTCVRSPRENGFDHIVKQLAIGNKVTSADIMGMGVGGLLR